jgi:hypothetical protein
VRELPICTDCQHCGGGGEFAKCYAPQGMDSGAVLAGIRGQPNQWKYCSIHRGMNLFTCRILGSCGREGRWFAPKEAK